MIFLAIDHARFFCSFFAANAPKTGTQVAESASPNSTLRKQPVALRAKQLERARQRKSRRIKFNFWNVSCRARRGHRRSPQREERKKTITPNSIP
jgi:hypothetical protein